MGLVIGRMRDGLALGSVVARLTPADLDRPALYETLLRIRIEASPIGDVSSPDTSLSARSTLPSARFAVGPLHAAW